METRGNRWWALTCVAVFSVSSAVGSEPPELELLEFLSDWQDADGRILDPAMFDDDQNSEPELEQLPGERNALE